MSTRFLLSAAFIMVVGVLAATGVPRLSFAQTTPSSGMGNVMISSDTSSTTASTTSSTSATSTATTTATLSLSPTSGMMGDFITANGSGFTPGENVQITFGSYITYLAANQSGDFSVSLLVPSLASTTSSTTPSTDTSGSMVTALGGTSQMTATAAFINTGGTNMATSTATTTPSNGSGTTGTTTASTSIAVSNVQVVPASNSTTITWTTSVPATSQVAYGTTTDYGIYSMLDNTLVTNHNMTLSALQPNTSYHFIVLSMDSKSNATSSLDQIFTTQGATSTGTTTGNMGSTTVSSSDLAAIWSAIHQLQTLLNSLQERLHALEQGGNGNGNGGSNPGGSSTASVDQQGQTVRAGSSIDFGGHNFGSEEHVLVMLNGTTIGQGFTNLGGGFSTGSMSTPSNPGTYTYTFVGQSSGKSATATITVQ